MTKTFVLIIVPLLLLTPAIVMATNESSYKFGYDAGFGSYQLGVTDHGEDGPPYSDEINADCVSAGDSHVTNTTACFDGFINGWKHWCGIHQKDCAVNDVPKPNPNYIKEVS